MKKSLIIGSVVLAGTIIMGGYYYNTSIISASSIPATQQQQEIKEKMLNAIDYYSYAKGSYYNLSSSGNVQYIEFEVQEGNNPGSHVIIKDDKGKLIKTGTANSEHIVITNELDQTFKKATTNSNNKKPEGPRKKVVDGETYYINRNDPASPADGGKVTFPQQLAFWLDDETNNYKIVSQETYLDRAVTVIEGKVIEGKSGDQFRMLVDTETGILLHFYVTTKNEKTLEIKVEEIDIITDISTNSNEFDLSIPEGYTDKSPGVK